MDNKLPKHLMQIINQANGRFELLMKQLIEKENITEELTATNQMELVDKINNIKNRAEEIILNEIIYR